MLTLPFEILRLIFKSLSTRNLLQCQLTSKEWHRASVELLYSEVELFDDETCSLYIRTISNSLQIGSYLKELNANILFQKTYGVEFWDQHNLLSALIQHCPNILFINCVDPDATFWSQISYAAAQGQLSKLQRLPQPTSEALERYIYAALFLKASLTTLLVRDDSNIYGVDLNHSVAYQNLQDQISEFKKLQYLHIDYTSNNLLSYFDTLIEGCQHLKSLQINLRPTDNESIVIEPETIINARPDIDTFICGGWGLINNESQLKYFMRKFPNLQSLLITAMDKINSWHFINTNFCPINTVIDFLHFMMAIPTFNLRLNVTVQDFPRIWIELTNMNDGFRDFAIEYIYTGLDRNTIVICDIRNTNLTVYFPVNHDATELPHTELFLEAGSMIRSLQVIKPSYQLCLSLLQIDSIFRILNLCPSLQELSIYGFEGMTSSSDPMLQYAKIKKLSVTNIMDSTNSTQYLEHLSLHLPNIKHLLLDYDHNFTDRTYRSITVNMPNIQLDRLTSVNLLYNYNIGVEYPEAYIKLSTDAGFKFYIGNRNGLLEVSEETVDGLYRNFCFNITCKSLKELVVCSKTLPYKEMKWVF